MLVPGLVSECWLSEVNPTTSKKVLTDNANANKDDMIARSPWSDWETSGELENFDEAHTLADAYAHSMTCGRRDIDLHTMRLNANTLIRKEP